MNTYIALISFTEQGLKNIQGSTQRAAAFKAAAKKAGVKVTEIFWTLGEFDGVIVFNAKDEGAAAGLMLSLASLGNVHTKTLRAFNAAEFAEIAKQAPKL